MKTIKKKIHPAVIFILVIPLALTACGSFTSWNDIQQESSDPTLFFQNESLIISLLILAAVVSIVTQRMHIPYTVGLVLTGFALTFVGQIPIIPLISEIILGVLVPPLVFEAAFHLNLSDLRKDWKVILSLTVPGVILSTLIIGVFVSFTSGLSLTTALLFGALISATDPIAVVALFRQMGAPKRLQTLLESESLLNDGTAIVMYKLILGVVIAGHFDLGSGVVQFITIAGGGIIIGMVTGFIVSLIIGRIDNYLIETTLTTILAYGAYLIAESFFNVSGVLAVVTAGLVAGRIGPRGMSPTTKIVVFNFWEYAAFIANTFIFLIIGLEIDFRIIIANIGAIGWAIIAVLLARFLTVYGLSWTGKNIPFKWNKVLFWGGLRGAISLALVLSLPLNLPNATQLQAMAFGVVLFTLVIEGLTMKPFIKRANIIELDTNQDDYKRWHARAIALNASQSRLEDLHRTGIYSDFTYQAISSSLEEQKKLIRENISSNLLEKSQIRNQELEDAWREILRTQRSTITGLSRDNIISEEIYSDLISEIDKMLINPDNLLDELPTDNIGDMEEND